MDDGGIVVEGDVATIPSAAKSRTSIGSFGAVFTAKQPFRLWGVPERAGDWWLVDAVDLHVGHPLRIGVLSDRIRVLLEPETRGNTPARLLTNLQQRLDARAVLRPVAA